MPIRRPASPSQSLSFTLQASARGYDANAVRRNYEWPEIVIDGSPLDQKPPVKPLQWSKGEEPRYAAELPLGPQVHVTSVLENIGAGHSLAITAPRRFGKSSLIAHLEERVCATVDAVSVRVDCNTLGASDDALLDHSRLWNAVSDKLREATNGVGLELELMEGTPPLPTAQAFALVRQQAARLGKRCVVVFFDEAQRLFETGSSFGHRLRNLIATGLVQRRRDGINHSGRRLVHHGPQRRREDHPCATS